MQLSYEAYFFLELFIRHDVHTHVISKSAITSSYGLADGPRNGLGESARKVLFSHHRKLKTEMSRKLRTPAALARWCVHRFVNNKFTLGKVKLYLYIPHK